MAFLRTSLLLLCLPVVVWNALRVVRLIRNYSKARKLNLPIIILPFDSRDILLVLLGPLFHAWGFEKLPFEWLRNWFIFSNFAWAQDYRHHPHEKYGPAFVLASPGAVNIVVADPAAATEVESHYKVWQKHPQTYRIFDVFGPNIITANGDDWQRQRRIVNPAFSEQNNKLVCKSAAPGKTLLGRIRGRRKA
jgi:hypothetical protein